MERIAKLLFATTVVTIFAYLLVFTSLGQSGSGGEYFGFDGTETPWEAARNSFGNGDYRFLEVNVVNVDGIRIRQAPAYQRCDNHPYGANNHLRTGSEEPVHGADSGRLATDFARQFNQEMTTQLSIQMGGRCEIRSQE